MAPSLAQRPSPIGYCWRRQLGTPSSPLTHTCDLRGPLTHLVAHLTPPSLAAEGAEHNITYTIPVYIINYTEVQIGIVFCCVVFVAGARSARIPAYQKLSRADATGTPATVGPRRVQGEVPRCNRGHRDHLEKPGR